MTRRLLAGSALLVLTFAGCSDDDTAPATLVTTTTVAPTTMTVARTTTSVSPSTSVAPTTTVAPTTAPAPDGVEIPLSFQGAWTGPITAGVPTVSPFVVDLDLAATGGTIAIERSECRGTLTPTAFDGSVLTLTGRWSVGTCLDGGTWRLTVSGIDELHYTWTSAEADRTDEGPLRHP